MSEKREKWRRLRARLVYRYALDAWMALEPPRWRIFAHRRWKKMKPKRDKHGGLQKLAAKHG